MADMFLWWDNEGTLEQRLQRAVLAYRRRRGGVATVCEMLPEAMNGEEAVAGLVLKPKKDALKNHYWLRVDAT